jgi:hypothetical protein
MCRSKAEGGRRCSGRYRASAARAADLAVVAADPGTIRAPLYGGQTSVTELATAPDGTRAVRKTPRPGTDPEDARFLADGEELAALLAEAVGAPVPRVYRDGPGSVWVEYVDGPPAGPADLTGSPEEVRIGLLDALTGNGDRYSDRSGNLKVRHGRLVGYDHGGAWLPAELGYEGPFIREPQAPVRHFIESSGDDGTGRWRDSPPLPAAELAMIRVRVEALRPAFRRAGRGAWLDYSLAALDQIAGRASAAA